MESLNLNKLLNRKFFQIFDTYKIGSVHTLLFRFFKICSSMENFHIEVEHLKSILKCNNYPAQPTILRNYNVIIT